MHWDRGVDARKRGVWKKKTLFRCLLFPVWAPGGAFRGTGLFSGRRGAANFGFTAPLVRAQGSGTGDGDNCPRG